jgi:hypothetical protein
LRSSRGRNQKGPKTTRKRGNLTNSIQQPHATTTWPSSRASLQWANLPPPCLCSFFLKACFPFYSLFFASIPSLFFVLGWPIVCSFVRKSPEEDEEEQDSDVEKVQ